MNVKANMRLLRPDSRRATSVEGADTRTLRWRKNYAER